MFQSHTMNEDQIEELKSLFPRKVHLADKDLWDSYDRFTWDSKQPGGEHMVYETTGGNIVKEVLPEILQESGDIGQQRFNRFSLELRLRKSPFLTTTIAISPTFSIELKRGKDLEAYMIGNSPPPIKDRLSMCKDLFNGIFLIHADRMAHLDLKPENIFINDRQLSIGDFGNLRPFNDNVRHSSDEWGPPTISTRIGTDIDMYSAAYITIGILTWKSSFLSHCRNFMAALLGSNGNTGQMCSALRTLFTHECMQEFNGLNLNQDLVEDLRCSVLGKECDDNCNPAAFRTIRILKKIIQNV